MIKLKTSHFHTSSLLLKYFTIYSRKNIPAKSILSTQTRYFAPLKNIHPPTMPSTSNSQTKMPSTTTQHHISDESQQTIMNLEGMRIDYTVGDLSTHEVGKCPIEFFSKWFKEAIENEKSPYEPNAMALATTDATGRPHCRIVLLKDVIDGHFWFFTNYESAKGTEISSTPFVALTFYWASLNRQVRVEGKIERISPEESDSYYNVRPRSSRIGAWSSKQSSVLKHRSDLEEHVAEIEKKFEGVENPPRPEFWGGYRVIPDRIEFWQGRPSRLHDRINFRLPPKKNPSDKDGIDHKDNECKKGPKQWIIERLSP